MEVARERMGVDAAAFDAAVADVGAQQAAEYEHLVSRAARAIAERNNLGKAKKQCLKAIALCPKLAPAHSTLGSAHELTGDSSLAAASYIDAMALCEVGGDGGAQRADERRQWAYVAARAYAMLVISPQGTVALPPWWHDEAMLELSARVVALLPDDVPAVKWRADALSGLQSRLPEMAEPRGPESLREAATCFQHLARLLTTPDAKRGMVKAGVACLARAGQMEEHRAASAGAATTAEATEAAEAEATPTAATPAAVDGGCTPEHTPSADFRY